MRQADYIFKRLLEEVVYTGEKDINPRPKWQDGTPAHSYFLTQFFEKYDTEHGEVPITSLRKIYVRKAIEEMLVIYQLQSSKLSDFHDHGIFWWDDFGMPDGTIGQRYGATVKRYNLVDKVLNSLKNDPFGRRHIISLWQEKDLNEPAKLPPCAFQTMFSVRTNENGEYLLDCTLIQRSNDIGPAMHVNLMQYHALQLAFCKHLGYKCGNFARFTQNIHLYDRHIKQAQEMIERKGQDEEPKFILDVPDGTNFYDIKASDFKLTGYKPCEPQLKFEIAV